MPRLGQRGRRALSLMMTCLALLIFTGQAEASDGLWGLSACVVEEEEVILDDFYFACTSLTIYGYIDGDVAGIASEVTLAREGHVTGDIWIVAGQVRVQGTLGDDVHFAGVDLDVTGLARFPNANTDLIVAAVNLDLAEQTVIPGDVIFYGQQAILRGAINGEVDFQGQSLTLQNRVAGDVTATIGNPEGNAPTSIPLIYSVDFQRPGLYFSLAGSNRRGYINGDLNYRAPQRISIQNEVGGQINYTQSIQAANITQAEQSETFFQIIANYILVTARDVIVLSIVGILGLNLAPNLMMEPAYKAEKDPQNSFISGFISLAVFFVFTLFLLVISLILGLVVFVLALSSIEITLVISLILVLANLGFWASFFFLWAFVGRAISCFVIGFYLQRWLQKLWAQRQTPPPAFLGELWPAGLIGVLCVSLIVNLPLGSLVNDVQLVLTGLLCTLGLGGLSVYLRQLWASQSQTLPPLPKDPEEQSDNQWPGLPPGFQGFDD